MSIENQINQDLPIQPDVHAVVDENDKYKPDTADIDKGWREQLSPERAERIKKWAETVVKQWHDEIKPDYIFLTETGGISYGYILKETWKAAYSGETIPKFLRVDPVNFRQRKYGPPDKDELYVKEVKKHFDEIYSEIITIKEPKIIVFDEGTGRDIAHLPLNLEPQKEELDRVMEDLFKLNPETREFMASHGKAREMGGYSIRCVVNLLDSLLKDKQPSIWASQQATPSVLFNIMETYDEYQKRILDIILNEKDQVKKESYYKYTPHAYRLNNELDDDAVTRLMTENPKKSRQPTTKAQQAHPPGDANYSDSPFVYANTDDKQYQFDKGYLKYEDHKIRANIVKHPEQLKRAIEYVNELQELGKEAGQELRVELEKTEEKSS